METKKCTICKSELPLDCFYKKTISKLPRSECKDCTCRIARERYPFFKEKRNASMRKHYEENKEQYQKKHAEYRRSKKGKEVLKKARIKFLNTKKGKESTAKSQKKYARKNAFKRRAHWAVKAALKAGKITRQQCCICGEQNAEAHHKDYDKPFDIEWLCTKHHKKKHRKINI